MLALQLFLDSNNIDLPCLTSYEGRATTLLGSDPFNALLSHLQRHEIRSLSALVKVASALLLQKRSPKQASAYVHSSAQPGRDKEHLQYSRHNLHYPGIYAQTRPGAPPPPLRSKIRSETDRGLVVQVNGDEQTMMTQTLSVPLSTKPQASTDQASTSMSRQ